MKGTFVIIILPILMWSFRFCEHGNNNDLEYEFEVNWVKNLESNFEFTRNWSYPESIYRNQYGQLSCDGICPIEIDRMKDKNGRIKDKFLKAFYEIIDTTHLFYSLESETNAPEFGEANFIKVKDFGNNEVQIKSETNISTHSSLNIQVKESKFSAWIDFGSITPVGNHKFKLKEGVLKIEEKSWNQGILKAEFDFRFEDTLFKKKEIFWKGKMTKKIEK